MKSRCKYSDSSKALQVARLTFFAFICTVAVWGCNVMGTWRTVYSGHVESIAQHPIDRHILYASAGQKILRSVDGGTTWQVTYNFSSARGLRELIVLPGGEVIGSSTGNFAQSGVYVSRDSGNSFALTLPVQGGRAVITHESEILIAASDTPPAIWTSADRGASWTYLREGISEMNPYANPCSIASSPRRSYFLISFSSGSIYRCTPNEPCTKVFSGSGNNDIPRLRRDPFDSSRYYAIMTSFNIQDTSGFMVSNDMGKTWDTPKSPTHLWALNASAEKPNTVIVGQFARSPEFPESSIYVSENAGGAWSPVGKLQDWMIWDSHWDVQNRRIICAGSSGIHIFAY
jgi:hypothetical protein